MALPPPHHIGEFPSSIPSERKGKPLPTFPEITLVLANTGSVARDHLASERTWLSYVHTSLGVVTMGVALVQLFTVATDSQEDLERFARPLGALTVFLGLFVLIIGVRRYFCVQSALTKGQFPVARFAALTITGVLALLLTVTFGILVVLSRT